MCYNRIEITFITWWKLENILMELIQIGSEAPVSWPPSLYVSEAATSFRGIHQRQSGFNATGRHQGICHIILTEF